MLNFVLDGITPVGPWGLARGWSEDVRGSKFISQQGQKKKKVIYQKKKKKDTSS